MAVFNNYSLTMADPGYYIDLSQYNDTFMPGDIRPDRDIVLKQVRLVVATSGYSKLNIVESATGTNVGSFYIPSNSGNMGTVTIDTNNLLLKSGKRYNVYIFANNEFIRVYKTTLVNPNGLGTYMTWSDSGGQCPTELTYDAHNTAPSIPGAFTQPTGELEIGDPKVFSVGSSSDAENNLSKYVWESSINGGSFTKIGETPTNNITYTIPTAKTLKIRVKAVDSQGLESAYRESTVFTVTKPKYYWSKYNANIRTTYSDGYGINKIDFNSTGWSYWGNIYKNYTFDEYSNKYVATNPYVNEDYIDIGTIGYTTWDAGGYTTLWVHRAEDSGYGYRTDIKTRTGSYDSRNNTSSTTYYRGALIQSGIIAEEGTYPTDGQKDGYWWVRGSRVNQSIAPPGPFTAPAPGTVFKPSEQFNIIWGASSAANLYLYEIERAYNEDEQFVNMSPVMNPNTSYPYAITTDKTKTKLRFRVRAKNTSGVYSDWIYSDVYEIQHNTIPVVTLNTEDNLTLYENDIFTIDGQAVDKDSGDFVNIRYKIDGGEAQALGTGISNGTDTIPFTKNLTFKAGKLYDGDKPLTDELEEGPAHTLRVWAEDGKSGNPVEAIRTFFVVPNRVPELTVDTIEQKSELINSDKITISGTCSDPDGNDVKVTYKINGGLGVEIYSGKDSKWSFDLSLSLLQTGENKVVIEVIDSYNFKASKTVKLYKTEKQTPLTASTARYKINPPSGRAKGVLLWLQREKELNVSVEISMGLEGEQEQYVPMTLDKSAPVSEGVIEDQFIYQVNESKDNIILKIDLSRDSLDVDDSIVLVAGVLE